MKIIILIFISFFLFSCNENKEKIPTKTETKKQIENKINFLQKPEKIEKLGFFYNWKENIHDDFNEEKSKYYKIWDFYFENKSWEIFFTESTDIYKASKFYFVKIDEKIYFLEKFSLDYSWKILDKKVFKYFSEKIEKQIPENLEKFFEKYLKIEQKIEFEKNNKKYELELKEISFFPTNTDFFEKIDFLENFWEFFIEKRNISFDDFWDSWFKNTEKEIKKDFNYREKLDEKSKEKFDELDFQKNFLQKKWIYKKLSDWTLVIYSLKIPFVSENEKSEKIYDFDFKNFKKNFRFYYDAIDNWCWVNSYVLDLQWNFVLSIAEKRWEEYDINLNYKDKDLEILSEKNGEKIYFFRDKNHDFLKKLFKSYVYLHTIYYDVDSENPVKLLNYEEFVWSLPIFFWQDIFGRKIAFIWQWIVSHLEWWCGAKPVIYLYPTEKQEILVSLDWKFKNLVSIPKYEKIWKVLASENWEIEFKGKKYEYLFWEDDLIFQKKEDWFVVKKENLEKFFDEKLSFLGFNEKEIFDFKDFWISKMQEKNYYFVRFYGNETMEKIAPISINPKPDSIQRIFIDYRWLEKNIEIPEQKLEKFERKGFSVIEWGWNLQK